MANSEHLEILRSGVEAWNKWRGGNKGIKPDLLGANLFRANLSGANLSEANLSLANLSYADLSVANLYDAYLSEAYLNDANLSEANLCDAYLSGAKLSRTDLSHASLADANLFHADLTGANLTDANLTRAYVSRANLTDANLSDANLSGADLADANLYRTNLIRTKLAEVKLYSTVLGNTVFGLTNLSTCKGFDSVVVERPCIIDFQTLRASKNLPKSFLLKIGLPELYIDYLPDFYQDEGIRLFPVFLSHSRENKEFARKLYEALIAKGVSVFFDEKKMKPGDDIYKSISKGIEHYDKMILVCSKDSLNSWWVDRELDRVLKKERNLQKEDGAHIDLLVPITIDDTIYQWNGPKAEEVPRYVIGDFKNWQDDAVFEKALNELIHALNVDRPEIKPPSFLRKR